MFFNPPLSRNPRRGFTLIELLVVIAIIAILIALLVPAVQKVRESANRTQCVNNMKQLGLAIHSFHDSYKKVPPNWYASSAYWASAVGGFGVGTFPGIGISVDGSATGTWMSEILPFIEQQPLFSSFNGNSLNNPQKRTIVKTFLCPSDPSVLPNYLNNQNFATTNYVGSAMALDSGAPRALLAVMQDGTSNTIMIAERYADCNKSGACNTNDCITGWAWNFADHGGMGQAPGFGWLTSNSAWTSTYGTAPDFSSGSITFQVGPTLPTCNPNVIQTPHSAMNVCMGDVSVRSVSPGISLASWLSACKPADGTIAGSDW